MSIIIFLLILGILVLVHELGHFIAAKKNGVLVEEFGIGFPPRLFAKKIGETLYSLNLIPLGGFVKVYGEEYHEKIQNKERSFINKKPWQKSIIIIAGVLMNLFFAIILSYVLLINNNFRSEIFPLFKEYNFKFGQQEEKTIVAGLIKNSPAQIAGVKLYDVALKYKLFSSDQWYVIDSTEEFIKIIKNSKDQKISIEFENAKNGESKVVEVIPKYNTNIKRAVIGVNLVPAVVITYKNGYEKVLSGFLHSYNLVAYNVSSIKYLINVSVAEKSVEPVSQTLSGPIGIFKIIQDMVDSSGRKFVTNLIHLTTLLSLSLAVMNIIPFPALDGGRLVFILFEWISGKRVNENFEKYFNLAGFILLIGLVLLVSINDITRIFSK